MSPTMSSPGCSRRSGVHGRGRLSSSRSLALALLSSVLLAGPTELGALTGPAFTPEAASSGPGLPGIPLHVIVQSLEFGAAEMRRATAESPRRAAAPRCEPLQRTRGERRRLPWGLGWLHRYGRDVEIERGAVAPPSLYLRSPLLSGLYEPRDCPDGDADHEESCAIVSLVADDDAAIEIEVPLPQLEALHPRQLRDAIRERIAAGETVEVLSTDGEDFDLMPGTVREIDARSCPVE
jgi:hypothetical protein